MRYKTGTKRSVIISVVNHAIRDQEALIDAHLDSGGQVMEGYINVVEECEAFILDYKQLKNALLGR